MELNNPAIVEQGRQSSGRYETALADNGASPPDAP
jgi:hypothetical protein